MPTPAIVEKLDVVPEAERQFYKQDGERFLLDVDAYTAGLRNNKTEILGDLGRTKDALKKFEGIDPEEYRTLKTQAQKAEEQRALKAGEFDSLKQQLIDTHATEKKDLAAQLTRRVGFIEKLLKTDVAKQALLEAGFTPEGAEIALPHVLPFIDVQEVQGAAEDADPYVARVIDARKQPRISGPQGEPMKIAELGVEFAKNPKYAGLVKGSGAAGSGAPAGSQHQPPAGAADALKSLSPQARLTRARELNLK